MSNTITIKKSGSNGNVPLTLEHGELALNYADGALYYKDSADVIVRLTDSLSQVLSKGNTSSLGMTIGSLNVDSGTLFVDHVHNRVGIGTTSPTESLSVSGNIGVSGTVSAGDIYSNGSRVATNNFAIAMAIALG
jgi:hypothetical protein